jgi:hypothetical protein
MKKNDKDYIPYGEEWKDELMKLPKIMIINMYRNVCLELEELNQLYSQACNAAGMYQDRASQAEKELRQRPDDSW